MPVPLPAAFTAKKTRILSSLSLPDSEYHDLSPKGSVDTAILPLIREINALDGLVTTSSCAGRISVYLAGQSNSKTENIEGRDEHGTTRANAIVVPGGKGGGRWLYTSHDPLTSHENLKLMDLFGFHGQDDNGEQPVPSSTKCLRLVRFQFEPMILHILTASQFHARPVLAAAINAGFRESGLQSLSSPAPMVAIRTAGLALESLIGYQNDSSNHIVPLVNEAYLHLLVAIANDRFAANTQRIERLQKELVTAVKREIVELRIDRAWEDPETRRVRMRAEGLSQKRKIEMKQNGSPLEEAAEEQVFMGFNGGLLDHAD